MAQSGPVGPSQRQLRVGELVRHALADALGRGAVEDPALSGTLVTVAEVRMTADLKHATALVSVIGGGDTDASVAALNRHARALRGAISPALRQMRAMPDLRFRLDTRFDDDDRIDRLLRSPVVRGDVERGAARESGEEEAD